MRIAGGPIDVTIDSANARISSARAAVRASYGIRDDAVVFGVFGGLMPDKRIPQVLDALSAIVPYAPSAQLLLAGASPRHYDPAADVRQRGLGDRVTITGYLASELELTDCIAACDVSLNLRWPTAREMSGPWLRALAGARPTITIDLAHLVDVPSIDPRTWKMNTAASGSSLLASRSESPNSEPPAASRDPVTVAIDILDEDHSLRLAMRRLATDPALRASLGAAGQRYWEREHSLPRMADDYECALTEAAGLRAPTIRVPEHLVSNGERVLKEVLSEFGLSPNIWK